jgi:putative choline sulfate-utilization transcription factor
MAGKPRLPPLQQFAVLEAAVRHRGFTAAARELGLTQSAVSRQISALEEKLGVPLFDRVWRGVTPTEACLHLASATGEALAALARAVEAARTIGGAHTLTVATDFAFAAFWLLPRMTEMRRVIGGVDVRIVTRQEDFDPDTDDEDVSIVFGGGPWPRARATLLVGEHVTPVASPGLLAEAAIGGIADLDRLPLLHLDAPAPGRWLGWADYAASAGTRLSGRTPGLAFNNYILVVQAAIAGQGLALGWRPLVDDALARGLLVPAPLPVVTSGRGYHLVRPNRRVEPAGAGPFRRWLRQTLAGLA